MGIKCDMVESSFYRLSRLITYIIGRQREMMCFKQFVLIFFKWEIKHGSQSPVSNLRRSQNVRGTLI